MESGLIQCESETVGLGELVNVLGGFADDVHDARRCRPRQPRSTSVPSAHPAWTLDVEHAARYSELTGGEIVTRGLRGGERVPDEGEAMKGSGEATTHLYELVR